MGIEPSLPAADGDVSRENFRFPRNEKLKGRDEIREVFNRRRNFSCSGAKLFVLDNGLPYNRIAFTFSRKFGNAVERNRSRRLSREVYRQIRNRLKKGYDLVLLIYPERNLDSAETRRGLSGRNTFSVRMDQLRTLFSRAGLWIFS